MSFNDFNKKSDDIFSFGKLTELLNKYKYVYLTLFIIIIGLTYYINSNLASVYRVTSSLIISSDINNSRGSNALSGSLIAELDLFSTQKNFYNEIEVLKSTPLISEALQSINAYVAYYRKKGSFTKELYNNCPFNVVFDLKDSQPVHVKFIITPDTEETFDIKCENPEANIYDFLGNKTTKLVEHFEFNSNFRYNEEITGDYIKFKIVRNEEISYKKGEQYFFEFVNFKSLVIDYQERMIVEQADIQSTQVNLILESSAPQKEIDFLNSLIVAYLKRNLNKKNFIAANTIDYIDNQLGEISDSLRIAERNLQNFRSSNQIMDINITTGRIYDQIRELETQKSLLTTQINYYDYILKYFVEDKDYTNLMAPSTMGIQDESLSALIRQLIELNSEKINLIESNQEKSPYLKKLTIRIDNIKSTIIENTKFALNASQINLNDLNNQLNRLNFQLSKLPHTQTALLGIERKFSLNDNIYTFLLQKRAEAEIAKVSNLPDSEVVEPPAIKEKIGPKKKRNYTLAVIISLLLPSAIFISKELLKNEISSAEDINRLTKYPVIAKIGHNISKSGIPVKIQPNSSVSETIKALRTNLQYFTSNKDQLVILVTSTVGGEGKSFVSMNLAYTIASFDQKVLLIEYDLRKPAIQNLTGQNAKSGLSSYLIKQATFEDIINPSDHKNLEIIYSGKIPPNPSELIASKRNMDFIEDQKNNYPVIILDAPPVGIVTDPYILIPKADLVLFVTRDKYTPRNMFHATIKEMEQKKIENVGVILNDVVFESKKYGYGYYKSDSKEKKYQNLHNHVNSILKKNTK